MEVEKYVDKTLTLLGKEREAELEENRILRENASPRELVHRGICIHKLRIAENKTGLYGRTVLKFQPYWDGQEVSAHNLTPGDIAGLSLSQSEGNEHLASGIVSKAGQSSVSVAFDELPDSLDLFSSVQYKLTKLVNDVTYKRLKTTLNKLRAYRNGPSDKMINVMFQLSEPGPPLSFERDGSRSHFEIKFFNQNLNDSQKDAVKFALSQRELAIIHGPPGTGKTTTVVEIIMQAVKQKLKILVCAPSNIAVDNLVERVGKYSNKIVRLGHPARLLSDIQKYSLDAVLANSDENKLVVDVRKELDETLLKLKKRRSYGDKQKFREDMKYLRKELREREKGAIKGILNRAEVIFATLTGATDDGPMKHVEGDFDLVIIDECSQALEAACWIPLLKGSKCILAGDHNQLPPTILSKEAAKQGLEFTLMERQLKLYGDDVMRMLTVQYRMHDLIMQWSSLKMYNGCLTADKTVSHRLLKDITGITDNENTSIPLLLIDTAGCYMNETNLSDEISKGNEGEADLVSHHVENLISCGINSSDIAVITPYNLQVEFLRLRLLQKYPLLEIKSVDGFQGREKEVVILSLVRSNEKGEVGFLAEDRRINVAITRAKRHLAIICDSETVGHHAFLKSLIEYMIEKGEVRSAQQYVDEGQLAEYSTNHDIPQLRDLDKKGQKSSETMQDMKYGNMNKEYKGKERLTKISKSKQRISEIQSDNQNAANSQIENNSVDQSHVLRETILLFIDSSEAEKYEFSSLLTSKERFLVHEIAESFGLLHISVGEGKDRHIVIMKKTNTHQEFKNRELPDKIMADTNEEANSLKIDECSDTNIDAEPLRDVSVSLNIVDTAGMNICDQCQREVPQNNITLHKLKCKNDNSARPRSSTNSNQNQYAKPKKKKPKSTKKQDEVEDFDSLIQQAIEQNNKCNFAKCKALTATIGQICSFCNQRFCLQHHIPEVHGCGAQAKAHARTIIRSDGVLYRGSGVPDKKLDANKRVHLQKKLDKKLEKLSDGRKIKKKDK